MTIDSAVFKKVRLVYRLSLAEMSALIDVSESHLCRIESNQRTISDTTRRAFVRALELTPEKLARLLEIFDETEVKARTPANIAVVPPQILR